MEHKGTIYEKNAHTYRHQDGSETREKPTMGKTLANLLLLRSSFSK